MLKIITYNSLTMGGNIIDNIKHADQEPIGARFGSYVITHRYVATSYREEGSLEYEIIDYAHTVEDRRWRILSGLSQARKSALLGVISNLLSDGGGTVNRTAFLQHKPHYSEEEVSLFATGEVVSGAFFQLLPGRATKAVEFLGDYSVVVSLVRGTGYVLQLTPPYYDIIYQRLYAAPHGKGGNSVVVPPGAIMTLVTPSIDEKSKPFPTTFRVQDIAIPFTTKVERPLKFKEEGEIVTYIEEGFDSEQVEVVDDRLARALKTFWKTRAFLRDSTIITLNEHHWMLSHKPKLGVRVEWNNSRG